MKPNKMKHRSRKGGKEWSLYILQCKDSRLYTGITNDLERRFKQHSSGKGARFTRSFGVEKLLYSEVVGRQGEAMVREAAVKRWPKEKKLALALGQSSKGKISPVSGGKDIASVASLADRIWREHYTPMIGKAQVDYMLAKFQSKEAVREQIKDGYRYFLIKEGGRNTGYLAVQPRDKELFLSKLYVAAEDRGKGYGKKAVEFAADLCRKEGLSRIALTVNKNNANSISTYLKCGFVITEPVVQDIGGGFVMDDYRMELTV